MRGIDVECRSPLQPNVRVPRHIDETAIPQMVPKLNYCATKCFLENVSSIFSASAQYLHSLSQTCRLAGRDLESLRSLSLYDASSSCIMHPLLVLKMYFKYVIPTYFKSLTYPWYHLLFFAILFWHESWDTCRPQSCIPLKVTSCDRIKPAEFENIIFIAVGRVAT